MSMLWVTGVTCVLPIFVGVVELHLVLSELSLRLLSLAPPDLVPAAAVAAVPVCVCVVVVVAVVDDVHDHDVFFLVAVGVQIQIHLQP